MTERLLHIATAKKPVYDADGQPIGETYASQDRDAIQAAKLLAQYGLSDIPLDGWPHSIEAQVRAPLWDGRSIEEMSHSRSERRGLPRDRRGRARGGHPPQPQPQAGLSLRRTAPPRSARSPTP